MAVKVVTRGFRVLVVEDYDDAREMYAMYLEQSGYEVRAASDGEDALRQARSWLPHAIMLDLWMPKMNGWELARVLKADPTTAHICLIVATGHGDKTSVTKAEEAGAARVLVKPVPPDLLVQVIEAVCRDKGAPSNDS